MAARMTLMTELCPLIMSMPLDEFRATIAALATDPAWRWIIILLEHHAGAAWGGPLDREITCNFIADLHIFDLETLNELTDKISP